MVSGESTSRSGEEIMRVNIVLFTDAMSNFHNCRIVARRCGCCKTRISLTRHQKGEEKAQDWDDAWYQELTESASGKLANTCGNPECLATNATGEHSL